MDEEVVNSYKVLLAPTAVEVAVGARLRADEPGASHLITGSSNCIRIYTVIESVVPARLNLSFESLLNGKIVSIVPVRLPGARADSLLISFSEAKVTMVDYDAGTNSLVTVSMHFYEFDDLRESRARFETTPRLVVDPQNRCAAMVIYNTKLVIVPTVASAAAAPSAAASTAGAGASSSSAVSGSVVIDLLGISPAMKHIKDICFLDGYFEPTLLILYTPTENWECRLVERYDNACVAALSLNVQQGLYPIIWDMSGLSFNAFRLIPAPLPIGGVLVLSNNAVVHLNQNIGSGIATNGCAFVNDGVYPFALNDAGHAFDLATAAGAFVAPDMVLLSTGTGQVWALMLAHTGQSARMSLQPVWRAATASSIVALPGGLVFWGSIYGDSMLLRVRTELVAVAAAAAAVAPSAVPSLEDTGGDDVVEPALKRAKLSEGDVVTGAVESDGAAAAAASAASASAGAEPAALVADAEDAAMYGLEAALEVSAVRALQADAGVAAVAGRTGARTVERAFTFDVQDVVVCTGPIAAAATGWMANAQTGAPQLTEQGGWEVPTCGELVVCCGRDEGGALAVLARGVRPDVLNDVEFAFALDVSALWTVQHRDPLAEAKPRYIKRVTQRTVVRRAAKRFDITAEQTNAEGGDGDDEPASLLGKRKREDEAGGEGGADGAAGGDAAAAAGAEGGAAEMEIANGEATVAGGDATADSAAGVGAAAAAADAGAGAAAAAAGADAAGAAEDEAVVEEHVEYIAADPSWTNIVVTSSATETSVFRSGLENLDIVAGSTGYYLRERTLLVVPVLGGRRAVQVTPRRLRLLDGLTYVQELSMKELVARHKGKDDMTIAYAAAADNYLLLLFSNGWVAAVRALDSGLLEVVHAADAKVVASCIDVFADTVRVTAPRSRKRKGAAAAGGAKTEAEADGALSDDELYAPTVAGGVALGAGAAVGGGGGVAAMEVDDAAGTGAAAVAGAAAATEETVRVFAVVIRAQSGLFELLSLPSLTVVFSCPYLHSMPVLLTDTIDLAASAAAADPAAATTATTATATAVEPSRGDEPRVLEVSMHAVAGRVVLIVFLSSRDIVFYDCFAQPSASELADGSRLEVRFAKSQHAFGHEDAWRGVWGGRGSSRVSRFANISGLDGLFILGPSPLWVLLERGYVRLFPQAAEGAVVGFAEFHSWSCPRGFIFKSLAGPLRLARLPLSTRFTHTMSVRKVPLHATPRHIAFHTGKGQYIVSVSRREVTTVHPEPQGHDAMEPLHERAEAPPNTPPAYMDVGDLRLVSPGTWETIDEVQLDEYETVGCIRVLTLRAGDARSEIVCVGTIQNKGDQVTTTGRILLFEVIDVNAQPGKPWTNHKLKLLCARKMSHGPVVQLTEVNGTVICAVGTKIFGYEYNPGKGKLDERTFHHSQMYTTALTSISNYVLVADVRKSVYLLWYRRHDRTLNLLSKDYAQGNVVAAEFLVDGRGVDVLAATFDSELFVYTVANLRRKESMAGRKLLRRTAFALPSRATALFRILMPPLPGARPDDGVRQATMVCAQDGSVSAVEPVPEGMFRRLLALRSKLITSMPQVCGLHPTAFRAVDDGTDNTGSPLLDLELPARYLHCDFAQQDDLARRVGSSRRAVWASMETVLAGTDVFC